MKEVNPKVPKGPFDWELAIFTCSFCGGLWRLESKEEADECFEVWGMGCLAYFKDCPRCDKKLAVEVPFLPHEKALFTYIYELERKVDALIPNR